MSELDVSILRPRDLSQAVADMILPKLGDSPLDMLFNDFNFSKDSTDPTGTGTITALYTTALHEKINKNDEIKIRAGWRIPGGPSSYLKDYITGYVKDVKPTANTLVIDFVDKGILLEQKATANYKQMYLSAIIKDIGTRAGFSKIHLDLGDFGDCIMDYTTNTDSSNTSDSGNSTSEITSGGGEFVIHAEPSCNYCRSQYGYKWYTTTFKDSCPFCGSKLEDNPKGVAEHEATCSKCGADFCGVCGREKRIPPRQRLTTIAGPTADATSSSTSSDTSSNDTSSTDTTTDSSSSSDNEKSFWDMLMELIGDVYSDFQIYVLLDTLYITQVPLPSESVLWVDDTLNLVEGSVTITDPNINITNTVNVTYGDSAHPKSVTVKNEELIKRTGKVFTNYYTKTQYNLEQATAYGQKMLHKAAQSAGFEMDCTVIGSSEWWIDQWSKTQDKLHDIDDTLYVTRINSQMSADKAWTVELTLAEYIPVLHDNGASAEEDQAADINSKDPVTLAKALKTAKSIFDWVNTNIQWIYYMDHRYTPKEVLAYKKANCFDTSDLLVLMFQAVGYKTWKVCHLHCSGYLHCNVKVVIGGKTVTADTSCKHLNEL